MTLRPSALLGFGLAGFLSHASCSDPDKPYKEPVAWSNEDDADEPSTGGQADPGVKKKDASADSSKPDVASGEASAPDGLPPVDAGVLPDAPSTTDALPISADSALATD